MRKSAETAIASVGVLVFSLLCLRRIAFSDMSSESTFRAFLLLGFLLILGVAVLSAIFSLEEKNAWTFRLRLLLTLTMAFFTLICFGDINAAIGMGFGLGLSTLIGWWQEKEAWKTETDTKKLKTIAVPGSLLMILFCLPFVFTIPLSLHHNQNQIEKDQYIFDYNMKVSPLENGAVVTLQSRPASRAKEHELHLEKFMSVGWSGQDMKKWEDIVVRCREGDSYWYKAEITVENEDPYFPERTLIFQFEHPWENHEISKIISFSRPPDPNETSDPNSL